MQVMTRNVNTRADYGVVDTSHALQLDKELIGVPSETNHCVHKFSIRATDSVTQSEILHNIVGCKSHSSRAAPSGSFVRMTW